MCSPHSMELQNSATVMRAPWFLSRVSRLLHSAYWIEGGDAVISCYRNSIMCATTQGAAAAAIEYMPRSMQPRYPAVLPYVVADFCLVLCFRFFLLCACRVLLLKLLCDLRAERDDVRDAADAACVPLSKKAQKEAEKEKEKGVSGFCCAAVPCRCELLFVGSLLRVAF